MFDKHCAVSYRIAGENVDYINAIRRQVTTYNGPKMEELRIQFIIGDIDEKKYKTMITTQENSREKRQANLDILEIYNTVTIENFQAFYAQVQDYFKYSFKEKERLELIQIFDNFNTNILRMKYYVNRHAIKIGYYYNQSINIIDDNGLICLRPKVSKAEYDGYMLYYNSKESVGEECGGVAEVENID